MREYQPTNAGYTRASKRAFIVAMALGVKWWPIVWRDDKLVVAEKFAELPPLRDEIGGNRLYGNNARLWAIVHRVNIEWCRVELVPYGNTGVTDEVGVI